MNECMYIYIPHISHIVSRRFAILLSEIELGIFSGITLKVIISFFKIKCRCSGEPLFNSKKNNKIWALGY